MRKTIITILIGVGFVLLAGYMTQQHCARATNAPRRVSEHPPKELLGPFELQELLNQLEPEHPLKVDGKIGPKTIAKWERVYCEQSALKTFKR